MSKAQLHFVLTMILAMMSCSSMAFEVIDESVIFANVAQGHHGNNNNNCHQISGNQLAIYGSGRINGTKGADLDFCSINDGSGLSFQSCDDGTGGVRKCTIDGSDIRGLGLTPDKGFNKSDGSGGGIGYCNNGDQLSLGGDGKNQFSSVALYSQCTLTLSSTQAEYRFQRLEMGGEPSSLSLREITGLKV